MPPSRGRRGESQRQRWLVSYADMMTLLFALFLVLFSCSTHEAALQNVLRELGGKTPAAAPPSASPEPPAPSPPATASPESAASPEDPRAALLELLKEKLGPDLGGTASLHSEERGVVVALLDSPLVFPSGSTRLSPAGSALVQRLAEVAQTLPHFVRVEGHTDNVPVGSSGYRSNWELSVLRAAAVTQELLEGDVLPERLSVMGYGQHRPRYPNQTEAGRARNRRVEIVFLDPVAPRVEGPAWSAWFTTLNSQGGNASSWPAVK